MTKRLDEEYVEWLYAQVANPNLKNPRKTFWSLFQLLYNIEFDWSVPHDDNRVEDGRQLRCEFLDEEDIPGGDGWAADPGCSFLEMLMALSRRLSDAADGEPVDWFWHFLATIGLEDVSDASRYNEELVRGVVERVVNRDYDYSGRGGLFPLRNPASDQREVELWYQMNAYILEQF